jgi:NADH:ubiquinone oxidoreductase subunit F (NADH-binding)
VSLLQAPPAERRLLYGLSELNTRSDLSEHHRRFGPSLLPLPHHHHRWREQFHAELELSGLTGRGGAEFPLAAKLAAVRAHRRHGIVVVNSMESEPASHKDGTLARYAPHLVLDGAELVAALLGSSQIYVCAARDRGGASNAYETAVRERRRTRSAGAGITVCTPPAHYVAGEESALSQWIDGGKAVPTFRPDRPSIPVVRGRVALVDNAETLAHVALIARYGSEWFRSVGTPASPGTRLLSISGAVSRPGVYEVALGPTMETVLGYAGISPSGIGGVLLGGYGGTWLPATQISTPSSSDELKKIGCSLGAGVVVALEPGDCGLAETARIVEWMATQSAGQCGPCVFGLPALADDLKAIATTAFTPPIVERLWRRLVAVEGRGACRHPDGVVRLVRSAFRAFSDDVDYHLANGPCPGVHRLSHMAGVLERRAVEWR